MKLWTLASISPRPTAGVVLFVIGCLLSTISILRDIPSAAHPNADEVAKRSDLRFATVKSRLPSRGVVGYIGESGDAALPDYYLAQYALAPLIVERGSNRPLVIGSFPDATMRAIPSGLEEVRDFGNGVILLSNKDAR